MKKISFHIIIVLFSGSLFMGCKQAGDPDKKRIAEANETIQKASSPFIPIALTDTSKTHIGIKVNFDNGLFVLDTSSISVRPGRLPYLKNNNMPFVVIYKDASGKQLGKHQIEDPTVITSCDEGGKPFTKKLSKGSFELLLPNNTQISTVEFTYNDKKVAELRIPSLNVNNSNNPNRPG
jgi:hypothetical protein